MITRLELALNMPILALLIYQTWKYKSGLMRQNETCVIWRSRCLKVKASLFFGIFNQPFLATNVCNTATYVWMYAVYLNTNPQATYFPNLDWHFQMTNPLSNNCTIQYLFCILAPFDPYGLLCTVWLADTQSFCMR